MNDHLKSLGDEMWGLCKELFPLCRSLTGEGVRTTLSRLNEVVNGRFDLHEVPTGTQCYDWVVPREWIIRDAYIIDPAGTKFCDFKQNNLHLVGYSVPVNTRMSLGELQSHLYSLPQQPNVIPYVTSYYKENWGFCLSQEQRESLVEGDYEVVIDSELIDGSMSYAELYLPGQTEDEILLSSYVCHPSMANNELSGPVVTTYLAKWLLQQPSRRYSYRIILIPETIGAVSYIFHNEAQLKKNVKAGYVLTCIGDDRAYSYLESRNGDTLSDDVARHVLTFHAPEYKPYSYLQRGSDERQFCSPGIDLPVASIMRSKYGEYPEYHTSGDDLSLVTPDGLAGGYDVVRKCLTVLENNNGVRVKTVCEPQLGKRGLYPTVSTKESSLEVRTMLNLLTYADGRSLLEIAEKINAPAYDLIDLCSLLVEKDLIELVEKNS